MHHIVYMYMYDFKSIEKILQIKFRNLNASTCTYACTSFKNRKLVDVHVFSVLANHFSLQQTPDHVKVVIND